MPVSLTHPPSPQTRGRSLGTLRPSPQPTQQSHRHPQTLQTTRGQRASIPYRPSRTATPLSAPPLTDLPSQPIVLVPSTVGPQPTETNRDTADGFRDPCEEKEGRHSQRRSEPTGPGAQVEDGDDDAELLDTILDGIGRMAVGTVAMQMDEAGRWRIRRDSGGESTW
ncbi:hypothetical protein LZ31DRAFT_549931 [Colletotrichum somersetense]|nr:hypothetical protein LZ31DRAFT_549931 [Colletotrichum somersetense]